MTWHPWLLPNLRGDPTRTQAARRGCEVFARLPTHRPMVVLVDHAFLRRASHDPKLQYLLQLLSDDAIASHLYADDGPSPGAQQWWNGKIDAYKDWVDVRSTSQDRRRLVAWFKDRKPYHKVVSMEDSAFARVIRATPPAAYEATGDAAHLMRADALAMLAAKAIRADLFVTERPLPHALGHDRWSPVTVMTPGDALPIIGLYLRRQARFVITRSPILGDPERPTQLHFRSRNEFYWHAAEYLLPEMYRWSVACRASVQGTGDDSVWTWQISVVQRVDQALQSRDRLLAALAVPQDMDTAGDVLNELDQILLWIMSALDATAKVAHGALGLPADEVRFVGWDNERWVRRVKRCNPALGALVTGVSTGKHLVDLVSPLRNLIHGAALSAQGRVPVVGPDALETLVRVPKTDRDKVLNAIRALGGLDAWGVGKPFPNEDLHIHPGTFVEQLLPNVLALLIDLMAAIPVEQLPGVTLTASQLAVKPPKTLERERTLWQLGVAPQPTLAVGVSSNPSAP